MTILDFFQLRAGTWASQRTTNNLTIKKAESGKSEIKVEVLPADDHQVVTLCQNYDFDPAICGAKVTWDSWDNNDQKHQGSAILIAIAADPNLAVGKLLCQYGTRTPVVGRYVLGDDVLSLVTEDDSLYAEEKIWFPRPNVCLRSGITIGTSHISTCYTEIRKASPAN